ncbi:hypothetical protein ACS0PU_007762 [Formica fusca]
MSLHCNDFMAKLVTMVNFLDCHRVATLVRDTAPSMLPFECAISSSVSPCSRFKLGVNHREIGTTNNLDDLVKRASSQHEDSRHSKIRGYRQSEDTAIGGCFQPGG